MQIDFHHTVTYVLARLAGFPHEEADIISYSSQYVDDAVNSGTIRFNNSAMYKRISSAHGMLDYRNFNEQSNHSVWIPFHFLPGNEGLPPDDNPDSDFVHKIVCTPNSHVAKDVIRICIRDHDRPYALHRLGIALHTYMDTWAHQNFAGINHETNNVKDISIPEEHRHSDTIDEIRDFFRRLRTKIGNYFSNETLPLGHGPALIYPDLPYLEKWSYSSGKGDPIVRHNLDEFTEAAKAAFRALINFRNEDQTLSSTDDIPAQDLGQIVENLRNFTRENSKKRHKKWKKSIARGDFSFGPANVDYIHKGKNSWKYQALGTEKEFDTGKEKYEFKPEFMKSNWKLFHDALQTHHLEVLRDILPKYGISAA